MHSPNSGNSVSDLAGANRLDPWPLLWFWPRHAPKCAAPWFRREAETIRKWLAEGVPFRERERLADLIDAQLDKFDLEIRELIKYRDRIRQGKADHEIPRAPHGAGIRLAREEAHGVRPRPGG